MARGDGARFAVKTRAGGFSVEWEEWPFEWVHQQRFRVFRKFKAGPVDTVDTVLTFAARDGGGARIGIRLELVPKIAWLAWMVRFGTRRAADALSLSVRAVDEALALRAPLPAPAKARPPESLERARSRATRAARRGDLARARRSLVRLGAPRARRRSRAHPSLRARRRVGRRSARAARDLPARRARRPLRAALGGHLPELPRRRRGQELAVGDQRARAVPPVRDRVRARRRRGARGDVRADAGGAQDRHRPILRRRAGDDAARVAQALLPASGRATLTAPAEPGRYRLFIRGGAAMPLEVAALTEATA